MVFHEVRLAKREHPAGPWVAGDIAYLQLDQASAIVPMEGATVVWFQTANTVVLESADELRAVVGEGEAVERRLDRITDQWLDLLNRVLVLEGKPPRRPDVPVVAPRDEYAGGAWPPSGASALFGLADQALPVFEPRARDVLGRLWREQPGGRQGVSA